MEPKILVIHPSRSRPEQAFKTCENWLNKAFIRKNIIYVMSVDLDDPQLDVYRSVYQDAHTICKDFTFLISNNHTCIEAINNAAEFHAKENLLIVVVSDDFDCPQDWDKRLLELTNGHSDFLVKTNDGYGESQWLITLPIMDFKYYQRFGYVYNPDYQHMWVDTEMTAVGRMLGKVLDLSGENLYFIHNHYTTGKTGKDALNERNDLTWNQGKSHFLARLATDFDLKNEDIVVRFPQEMFI